MSGFQASRTVPTNPRSARGKYCAGGGELLGVGDRARSPCATPFKPTRRVTPYVGFAGLVSVVGRINSRSDLRPSLSIRWPSPDWGSLLRWYGKGNVHSRLVGGTAHRDGSEASVLSDRVTQAPSVGAAGRGRPPQAAARRAGLEFVEKLLTRPRRPVLGHVGGPGRRGRTWLELVQGVAGSHRERALLIG
jgi:hypothetical protein